MHYAAQLTETKYLRVLLCQPKIAVNSGANLGMTALMLAIQKENVEAVDLCLKWGSCPYVLNSKGHQAKVLIE